jgi:SAM-dependent methyltransferase
LDFGCGGGDLLKHLHCGRRIGIEINPAARHVALRNGIEVYDSLDKVEDGCADIVLSNHAIEHVLSPLETLRELRSKLKPSGLLLICVPIDDWRIQRSYDHGDINHHLYTWTPQSLGNLLMEGGFACDGIQVRVITDAWPPRYQLLYRLLPWPVFQCCCRLTAVLLKRRQLLAVCRSGAA